MTEKYLGHNLVFIISLPRSGSTMLQRVLAGNPDVGTSSEPWILLHQAYGRRSTGIETDYGADWAALGVNEFVAHFTDGDEVYDDAVRAFARVLYENAMHKNGAKVFVDKTPRYVLIIPELIRWFPAARFVFLLRNPLAVLASVVTTQISKDLTTLERFAGELLEGPAAMLRGMAMLGERAITVRYENFVAQPDKELERLCTQLGLQCNPAMLDYSQVPKMAGFMQDRTGLGNYNRPTDTGAEKWKLLLENAQYVEFARGYLAELDSETIDALGYPHAPMQAEVAQAQQRFRRHRIALPWRVAVLSPRQKRGLDQLASYRYRCIRDYGPLKSRLMIARAYILNLIGAFRFVSQRGMRRSLGRHERTGKLSGSGNDPSTGV